MTKGLPCEVDSNISLCFHSSCHLLIYYVNPLSDIVHQCTPWFLPFFCIPSLLFSFQQILVLFSNFSWLKTSCSFSDSGAFQWKPHHSPTMSSFCISVCILQSLEQSLLKKREVENSFCHFPSTKVELSLTFIQSPRALKYFLKISMERKFNNDCLWPCCPDMNKV